MSKVMIFSADGHAAPPLEDYRQYVEQAYLPAFDESVVEAAKPGIDFSVVHDPDTIGPWKEAFFETGRIDGRWDMARRLRELESEGIVGEVLFPDGAPFGAGDFGGLSVPSPPDLTLAGARAYNRWLVDFISQAPGRFVGHAIVALDDIDEAIKDVHWAAEHGLKGLFMPGIETDAGTPPFWDSIYEPFWAACAEADLPLNFHGGMGLPHKVFMSSDVPLGVRIRVLSTEFPWFAHRPLWWLIWSGALERHPNLRLVFTEQQTDWVPGLLRKLDHSWAHGRYASIKDIVPEAPSFYWNRQCYVGSSVLSKGDLDVREDVGVDRMMFGADFPHPEGTGMRTLSYLQATVGRAAMSEADATAFLGGNAVAAFGLDLEMLEGLAQVHGPEMSDVLTPMDEDTVMEMFRRTDVIRPPA